MICLFVSLLMMLPLSAKPMPGSEFQVSYQNISLRFDGSLGNRVGLLSVPAVDPSEDIPWWQMMPERQQIALEDYPLAHESMLAQVKLFPIADYEAIGGPRVAAQIRQLHGNITSGPAFHTIETLPYLPLEDAEQVFHAEAMHLNFDGGIGIRYITAYAQDSGPVADSDLFYTFQGMTADSQYYIAATFPVRSHILPETAAAGTIAQDDFEGYIEDTVNQLNRLTNADFSPNLGVLDALIESSVISDAGQPNWMRPGL
jgi:hypothetical protein